MNWGHKSNDLAKWQRQRRGKRNQKKGNDAELVFIKHFELLGFVRVRKIHTGMKFNGKTWVHAESVDGDISGMAPNGKALLAECKSCAERLVFSALQDHQVKNLNETHENNGLAFLCWREETSNQFFIMKWPIDGFKPRSSITIEKAAALAIKPGGSQQPIASLLGT